MTTAVFEPAIPANRWPHAQALDRAATGIGFAVLESRSDEATRFHWVTGKLWNALIDQRLLPNTRQAGRQAGRQTGIKVLWYQLLLHECLTPHISHDTRPNGDQLKGCGTQYHTQYWHEKLQQLHGAVWKRDKTSLSKDNGKKHKFIFIPVPCILYYLQFCPTITQLY